MLLVPINTMQARTLSEITRLLTIDLLLLLAGRHC